MCAARCHRSLKRDEEITLWRSLCALGAPLYGNLCISFSPTLSLPLSLSFSAPHPSLSASRSRLFLPSPSLPPYSPTAPRTLFSLLQSHLRPPRSLGEAYASRHFSYSIVLSSGFPLVSTPLLPLLFFPVIISLSLTLSFFSLTLFQLVRAPLPLLLFPLLICFPLPVGNCALSLLPSRRYSLVCTCRCSPQYGSAFFAHLLFLLLTASLPPAPFYFTF